MAEIPNMRIDKNYMPVQDPSVRIHNFKEVALGYEESAAIDEAKRCLHCINKPCVSGCPVRIQIPDFIQKVKEGKFEEAYQVIAQSSSLPAVCGRVCPQETQCEAHCVRGIKGEPVGIGRLERFVADWHNRHETQFIVPVRNGHKVAVVGSGPSGLACAGDLARLGYEVTIFEALHKAGGVLAYGIPEFRLPKDILKKEIDNLEKLGVQIKTNVVIGKTFDLKDLFRSGFEGVFIGAGAGLPRFMGIEGETLNGVYSANEFLTRCNLMGAYKNDSDTPVMKGGKIAVVGGGNVAMDAARTALRLGAEKVYIIYRRSEVELPARREEIEHAKEEGIEFRLLTNPVAILGYNNPEDKRDSKNGFVTAIRCLQMKLGEPDERGRRRPIEIEGSEFDIPVDCVIMAIGTSPNPLIKSMDVCLETNSHGGIVVQDESGRTSIEGVYAGGDAVTGAATVISAMGAGKVAAQAIDNYIKSK